MSIHLSDVKEIRDTKSIAEVNGLLEQGWVLYSMNLEKGTFLLMRC